MKAYDKKYEVCPAELGITKKNDGPVFDKGSGVMIG